MGRFIDDFKTIAHGMGIGNAFRFVAIPRIMSRLGSREYDDAKVVSQFIEKEFGFIAEKYQDVSLSSISTIVPDIIWVFWWQGEEKMPPVIHECYESICRNANGRKVNLLSEANYEQYVQLPEFVVEKFRRGIISSPHFSDIVRVFLLNTYGGLWIDAGCFATRPIEKYSGYLFSPKCSLELSNAPHLSQWVMGVMGMPPQMPLMKYMEEMLFSYWHRYNTCFSYLMFDYFIRYAYEHIAWIKHMMDVRNLSSPDIHSSRYTFNQECDEHLLDVLIANNTFLSLTYRIPYPLVTENGKETYYAALLRKCKIQS